MDEKGFDPLLTGDPRDAEIAGLKVRLVRAEMDRSEIASRAAAERREAHLKIQTATRSIEEAQHIADQVQVQNSNGLSVHHVHYRGFPIGY